MILIISHTGDPHARAVARELRAAGTPYHLYDTARFPTRSSLSLGYGSGTHSVLIDGDKLIDLQDVRAVWWRRPQPFQLHAEVSGEAVRNWTYGEATEAFEGRYRVLDTYWINDPSQDLIASRKAYQLKVAAAVGLRIPHTLITSEPVRARAFTDELGHDRTVYKPFKGTEEVWRETRVLRREELALLDNVKYAPLIFQEYIEATADLRITVVGDRLFPAAIYAARSKYPQDFRMDLGNCPIKATELPRPLEKRLLKLMRQLGLVYGAIDMRLTPQGDYVFLEINPAGQWLFVEQVTGQPIARTLAEQLTRAAAPERPAEQIAVAQER